MKTNRELTRINTNKCLHPVSARSAERSISGSIAIHRCTILGALATQAMIAEAELTPKPGLVDRRGSGAHSDLSLAIMRKSAVAIEPFIRRMALQSLNERPGARLRGTLAAIGRAAERAMLLVTNGSNTHKGSIWTLGLLAAAAAASQSNLDAGSIARTAGLIASFEDPDQEWTRRRPNAMAGRTSASSVESLRINTNRDQLQLPSHGQIVAQRFGVTGARGEAMNGFPHIIELGLPTLRARRKANAPERIARLDALLAIMAELDDTCLLYRGGKEAQQAAKEGATAVIDAGGAGSIRGQKCLFALDKRLLDQGVSPGGSADLLAGTLFLDAIERQQTEIPVSPMIRSVLTNQQKLVQPWSLSIFERR